MMQQLAGLGPGGPPGGGLPPGLAGLQAPDQDQGAPPAQDGGLSALQDVIDDFPPLLSALHDPGDVDMVANALKTLTAVQKRLMQQGGNAPSAGR